MSPELSKEEISDYFSAALQNVEPQSIKYHIYTVATNGDSSYHRFLLISLQWADYSFFRQMSCLRFIEKAQLQLAAKVKWSKQNIREPGRRSCFLREISVLIKETNKLCIIKVGGGEVGRGKKKK